MAVDLKKIYRRVDLPSPGTDRCIELFSNVWKLKHPALRALRLKLCYKNVYSNERRHRFGLTDSPLCAECQHEETVEHQIFECQNAKRLWAMYRNVTGSEIRTFGEVLLCSSLVEIEIVKSAIIKALIQIDRNHHTPVKVIAKECAHYVRLEAIANSTIRAKALALIDKLNAVP